MTIVEAEQKLFCKWRARRPSLIRDGVVDEATYVQSTPRILFVLKEVNDKEGTFRDLKKYLRLGVQSQTWDNVTRWTHGLRRLGEDLPWSRLENLDVKMRIDAQRSISVMNLKKWAGGHTTDSAALRRASSEDRAFIRDQFSLYAADLSICCGSDVVRGLESAFRPVVKFQWQVTRRGVSFAEHPRGKYIVAFSHPAARVTDSVLYYGLLDACREILKR